MLTIIGAGKWPGLLSPAQSFSKATAARRKIGVSMFGEKNTWTSFHVFYISSKKQPNILLIRQRPKMSFLQLRVSSLKCMSRL